MDDERAQLMLVGAITIAVIFLGLVTVLNAGLFTSNVAPRAGLSATADAETFVDGVEHDVPILFGATAEDTVEGEVYAYDPVVEDEIDRYESYISGSMGSERPVAATIALNRTTSGGTTLIVDNESGTQFDSVDDPNDSDWVLARDVSSIGGTVTLYEFSVHNASGDSTFAIEADDGGDVWRLEIYWDEGEEQVYVQSSTEGPSGFDYDDACTISQKQATNVSGVTVNLTDGTVANSGCSVATVNDGSLLTDPPSAPYDVTIRRDGDVDATYAKGTYAIAVVGDADDDNVTEGGPNVTDVPYSVPQLDAAWLDLRYTSPTLTYNTTVRVEPTAVDLPPPSLSGLGLVFVNDSAVGRLSLLPENDAIVSPYDVDDAQVTGPAELDFDVDGRVEVPYVDDDGAVRLIDGQNESARLTADGEARSSKSRLAVGRWNGSPTSVFYAGNSDNYIYRITPGGSPEIVVDGTVDGHGTKAALGPVDIDGDGEREFVYVDEARQIRYLDHDGGPEMKIENGSVGVGSGIGVGPPNDFDGDGVAEVPFVDGSGNLMLINASGNPTDLQVSADQSPLAVRDVNDDGDAEIVYLDNGKAYYLDGVGTGTTIERPLRRSGGLNSSAGVNASKEQGVA